MNILTPCFSGPELLSQDFAKNYLLEIKSLVSCPENIYRQLYLSTLHKLAEYCQAMPFSESEFNDANGFLIRQLQLSIAALKLRRGILLPKNAGAEAIAAEEAQWTYAIFSSALLKDLHNLQLDRVIQLYGAEGSEVKEWSTLFGTLYEKDIYYQMKFIKKKPIDKINIFMAAIIGKVISFIPEKWIRENKYLFSQWWEVLLHEASPNNDIEILIHKAADKAGILLCSKKNEEDKDINLSKKVCDENNTFIIDDIPLNGWS
jgi:hypothetical protein